MIMAGYFIIFLFTVVKCFVLCLSAFNKHCEREDITTLTCNYIPKDIPSGVISVHIEDFKEHYQSFVLNSSYFQSDNWKKVKYLELSYSVDEPYAPISFKTKCFSGLKNLQELHIHLKPGAVLDVDAFIGLDNVKLLDMSGCIRVSLADDLLPSLNAKDKLPGLENLKLSKLGRLRPSNNISTYFVKTLQDKKITSLDLSFTKNTIINVSALSQYVNNLKKLNVSFSSIMDFGKAEHINVTRLEQLDVFDLSHLGNTFFPPVSISNMTWYSSDFNNDDIHYFLYPKMINASAMNTDTFSLRVVNCTLVINTHLPWKTQEVISRENSITYLDLIADCSTYSAVTIKHIDLANNRLEFLHPSLRTCFPNLEMVDLSENQLSKMVRANPQLFSKLFLSLSSLRLIYLSSNDFRSLPVQMFIHNLELEIIDLSNNKLDQVTISLAHLQKLKVLNLQYNKIKILNGNSIQNIDSLKRSGHIQTTVKLEFNPLSCSSCQTKDFLKWLLSNQIVNISLGDLRCISEDGSTQKINQLSLEKVQSICNRKSIIILACVSSGFSALIFIVVMSIIYRYRKRAKMNVRRRNLLNKLQDGQGQYEFVAFLSLSSDDIDYVDNYLENELNGNLQIMTGIERNIVCVGDKYLRPGFPIPEETIRCIQRSSAFIAIVSNSYCTSDYCIKELDEAYRLNKPIILMILGHVDETLMTPMMKMLFKSNVRVIITEENNEYKLKTTWEHVCSSILDVIAQQL